MRGHEVLQHNQGQPFNHLEPSQLFTTLQSPGSKVVVTDHVAIAGNLRSSLQTAIVLDHISSVASSNAPASLCSSQGVTPCRKRLHLAHRSPIQESFRRTQYDVRIPGSSASGKQNTSSSASKDAAFLDWSSCRRPKSWQPKLQDDLVSSYNSDFLPSKHMLRRLQVAKELLETERKYVDNLFVIQFSFIGPLIQSLRTEVPILSAARLSEIFSNFIDILHINSTLLAMLEDRLDPEGNGIENSWDPVSGSLSDIFASFGHYLKIYQTYCRNFTSASIALQAEIQGNAAFRAFLGSEDSTAALSGLTLQGHLLLPVQRIPRYKMLLSEMLRFTMKDLPDHAGLSSALSVIEDVATGINESIRRHESWQALREIEARIFNLDCSLSSDPSRVLIKRGPVVRICSRSHQPCEFFLFSDCLIYATRLATKAILHRGSEYFKFGRRVPLAQLNAHMIDTPSLGHGKADRFLWCLTSPSRSFIAYSHSEQSRADWLAVIGRARSDHLVSLASLRASINGTLLLQKGRPINRMSLPIISPIAAAILWQTTEYPIFRNLAAPIWIEDSVAPNCLRCSAKFNFLRARHHCRICGNVICASCSSKRFMTSSSSPALRACNSCYDENLSYPVSGSGQPETVGSAPQMGTKLDQHDDVPPIHLGTMNKSILRTIGRHKHCTIVPLVSK